MNIHTFWDNNKWGKKKEKYYEHVNEILVTYNDKFKQQLMNELREYNIDIVESTNKIIRYSCKSFVDILNLIKSNEPIFLQYYQPVLSKFDINNQNEMNCSIKKICDFLSSDISYCVQVISYDDTLNFKTTQNLKYLIINEIHNQNLSVSIGNENTRILVSIIKGIAYIGVLNNDDCISDRIGGILYYSHKNTISRAELKLEECFSKYNINNPTQEKHALDLGASPGGWTHFLSKHNYIVDSVDPAKLDKRLLSLNSVTHYKMTAQNFLESKNKNKSYELIVDDMKLSVHDTVNIILDLLPCLKSGGNLILTLKLDNKGITKQIIFAKTKLEIYFEKIHIKHLYYNRHEVTLYAENFMK